MKPKAKQDLIYLSAMLGTISLFYFLGATKLGAPKLNQIGKKNKL